MPPKQQVLILGLEPFHERMLEAIPRAENYQFHGLFNQASLQGADIPIEELLEEADQFMRQHPMDAIATYWDFPATLMTAHLAQRHGLRGPSLESVLRCEHKYWSRLEQAKLAPEVCPPFEVIDPFDDDPWARIALQPPFWIKPIKGFEGALAFRIEDREDFDRALGEIRRKITRIARPFDYFLELVELPEELRRITGRFCICEGEIGGHQCTIEGYRGRGPARALGIIDSIRLQGISSFARYQYPPALPEQVRSRISETSCRIMEGIGYQSSTFNIEFFWDEQSDRLSLLEINPRLSQSHSRMFLEVDGAANLAAMVQVACGEEVSLPHREGEHEVAAKFYLRTFDDGRLTRVPRPAEIEALQERLPGTVIHLAVREGDTLSELHDQDAYSYRLGHIFLGADDEKELNERYRYLVSELHFETEGGAVQVRV